MNIYIQMEIVARELEGRLLLALAAAERGHRVLLGEVQRLLSFRPSLLPPGIFHDKSLTPTARKIDFFGRLRDAGHLITSQDEEHWLALPSYDVPAVRRFSEETLDLASRSFAWGPHEAEALRNRYPEFDECRIVATGSPRTDYWRPEFKGFHETQPLRSLKHQGGYLLVSSNFSIALDVNSFWIRMRDKRHHFIGLEDSFEFDRYSFASIKYRLLGEFVRAVRVLATRMPETLIVIRPHPIEARGAWNDLIGPIPNVLVSREGSLSTWISGSRAVIQNDCTSAYEAAVAGVPVISFCPDGIFKDHPANLLGRRADDREALVALAREAYSLDPVARNAWIPEAGIEVLRRRLTSADHELAADRMAEHWTQLSESQAGGPRPWPRSRVLAVRTRIEASERAARVRDWARTTGEVAVERFGRRAHADERPTGAFATSHKFPALRRQRVDGIVRGLQGALGRFRGLHVRLLADDLIEVRPRPGSRDGATGGL